MTTKYSAGRKPIGELLSLTNPPILVPDWQRNYSWSGSEIEAFWQDLIDFNNKYPEDNIDTQEYFLGSVVLVDQGVNTILLDGQQRLATCAILLSVIRDFLKKYRQEAATRLSSRYLTDFDDSTNANTFKLTMNRYDRDFFRREILETRKEDYIDPIPLIESHNLIRNARAHFIAKFDEQYANINDNQSAFNWSLRIQKVLTYHLSVVAVVSEDYDNAASVFETLNDRGIGLSTPDLLRNLIMRRANQAYLNEVADIWGEILETESDSDLRAFMRHYWISNEGDVKSQGLYREIKKTILERNEDSIVFSRKLRDSATLYRQIVSSSVDNVESCLILADINELSAKLLYPAVLSAIQTIGFGPELIKVLKGLLIAYVRHSTVGRLENSVLEAVVYSIARQIRTGMSSNECTNLLVSFCPNDEQFASAFTTAIIKDRASARYLLRELEHARRPTEELRIAMPSRVHVEHIYPQTPSSSERWSNHDQVLNRLGNLTLLSRSLNTSIKNKPFAEKLPYYQQSEILLTTALILYGDWNFTRIQERQAQMAENAPVIWAFPQI